MPLGISLFSDSTHIECNTLSALYALPRSKRKWGMIATVFADPTPANNGDYRLVYNLSSTSKTDNSNWQVYAPASSGGGITITETYANITAMLADQANQDEGKWYRALDASDDDDVDNGWAVYEKLNTSTGSLNDYYLITDQEGLSLLIPSTIAISSADLRNCGSSPITIIPAQGATKFPLIDRILVSYKAGGVAFDFTSELVFKTVGGDNQFIISGDLNNLTDSNFDLVKQGQKQIANVDYVLTTADGSNASVGTGDIEIKIFYTIENVNL